MKKTKVGHTKIKFFKTTRKEKLLKAKRKKKELLGTEDKDKHDSRF